MDEMTSEERAEFEQELQEEARREYLQELHHERCMSEDLDYAYDYVTNQLSDSFKKEFHTLYKECRKYDLDWKEVLNNL